MIKNFLLSLLMFVSISFPLLATEFISIKAYKGNQTVENNYMINLDALDSIYTQKTSNKYPYEVVFVSKDTYFVRFFVESERTKFLKTLKSQIVVKEIN